MSRFNLPYEWFGRVIQFIPRPAARWSRLFCLATLAGIVAGLAAAALHWGLEHGSALLVGRFTHVGSAQIKAFKWGVLLLPALGGLASGLLVRWLCPTAVGHGADVLTRAFHRDLGAMSLRGPLVKAGASIGVISCGGSAGPEGPIAALGAAVGSSVGKLFGLTPRERRVLLVAGCAAGIGAIFQCPLGGALFAASILYYEPEFESDAIVPGFVASVVGYTTFMLFPGFGHRLLEGTSELAFTSPLELLPYAVLGPICGLSSMLLAVCLKCVERVAEIQKAVPRWVLPGLGGLATGALACILPQVMDGQYHFIESALDGRLLREVPDAGWWWWAGMFLAVLVCKCVATGLTVGSGASGGALGPAVFIGGVAGAFLGCVCQALFPGVFPDDLRQALIPVGMAGVLAAGMRVPMAAIVMVMEMTGSYGLIVPLMVVCSTAYVVGRRIGLNSEQVRSAAESPAHAADAVIHLLESRRVGELMEREWRAVATPEMSLAELVKRIEPGTRPVFAVTQGDRLVGIISVPDIESAFHDPGLAHALIASDMMTTDLATVFPDEDLYQALNVFQMKNHDVLPVVSRDHRRRWLGMISRKAIYDTLRRHVDETQKLVLLEYSGLSGIEREGQLEQLSMGVSMMRKDVVKRLIVPLQAIGQSLREADFRRQFGAQVVAIEEPDGSVQCPPDLDTPLHSGQRLLAIVWDRSPPADSSAAE